MAIRMLPLPTVERVRETLAYDPLTGVIVWKKRLSGASARELKRWNTRYAGKSAISTRAVSGHLIIMLDAVNYQAHRIMWLHYYGKPPSEQIDHVNGDPTDNRLQNLRPATHAQNIWNRGPHKNSKSGVKGVYWNKDIKKWHAQIRAESRRQHLGFFDDLDAAASAYRDASQRYHGQFSRAA